jgi:thioredoxin 1
LNGAKNMIEYNGQAYEEVVGSKGLVVVQYYATWCGPCKMLKPVLESIATDWTDTPFYRLDIDQFRDQAVNAGIRSVPTVVLYKDGEEVDRQSGYQPRERIEAWLNQNK